MIQGKMVTGINFCKSINGKIKKNIAIQTVLVWVLFFCIYGLVYLTVNGVSFLDDQWFHFKYAYLLRTQGWKVVTNFPWLHFTDLVKYDRSYGVTLYHYALVPFTLVPDLVLGMKLAGLTMAATVYAIFFYAIKKMSVPKPLVWTLIFFVFSTFNFADRMLLTRNLVLVSVFGVLEFYFLIRRKYAALLFLVIIHTWWHPATFWVAPFIAGSIEMMRYLNQRRIEYKGFFLALTGSLLGFLFFPINSDNLYAPMNPFSWIKSFFYYFQGVSTGAGVKEGVEVYKLDLLNFAGSEMLLTLAIIFISILSVWIYVIKKRGAEDPENDADDALMRDSSFLIVAVLFLGMIEISGRFQDFLMPFIFLGLALIHKAVKKNDWLEIRDEALKKAIVFSLTTFFLFFLVNRILTLRNSIKPESSYIGYAGAGEWLKNNTAQGVLVFNTDWGQFPRLFFYDDWNYYVTGIEPKNLSDYDPKMYWLWYNISSNGLYCERQEDCSADINNNFNDIDAMNASVRQEMARAASQVAPVIKNTFQSRYIFFDSNSSLRREVEEDKVDFELKYSDKDHRIYIYFVK